MISKYLNVEVNMHVAWITTFKSSIFISSTKLVSRNYSVCYWNNMIKKNLEILGAQSEAWRYRQYNIQNKKDKSTKHYTEN